MLTTAGSGVFSVSGVKGIATGAVTAGAVVVGVGAAVVAGAVVVGVGAAVVAGARVVGVGAAVVAGARVVVVVVVAWVELSAINRCVV